MTAKRKELIEKLITDLKESHNLTATEFFQCARQMSWGIAEASASLVNDYKETLQRMFIREELTFDELNKAMNP